MAATYDLGIAEMGILETAVPFMALGGYRGGDPIFTVAQFSQLVANDDVRFFLSLTDPAETFPQQTGIKQWSCAHCQQASIQVDGVDVWETCKLE
ncbi:MAG: hypothetical protein GY943_06820 [Chloroflexi bacterium]|nr:hypothetical protein [Chloroflexota bacterium]